MSLIVFLASVAPAHPFPLSSCRTRCGGRLHWATGWLRWWANPVDIPVIIAVAVAVAPSSISFTIIPIQFLIVCGGARATNGSHESHFQEFSLPGRVLWLRSVCADGRGEGAKWRSGWGVAGCGLFTVAANFRLWHAAQHHRTHWPHGGHN